ncbi:YobI family P-loop NTPase [Listeria fleischmannii]|uniref:YobI-like P-loop NTPase domain-containing protein n=1 Tax=Listeria fleischmannii FSL S10-1203 TaxID=1265822 RepID=W7DF00_9LIST|nr:recombinase family protein [Listeria fleischmannii]EUJ43868.1 hypothetical protein MCOL2_20393 [Listeria fleischmannii FSL S10-1203]
MNVYIIAIFILICVISLPVVVHKKMKTRFEGTPGALYPAYISEEKIKPYQQSLDKALNDDAITNIAVTAPYGVGKSTILENYFHYRRKKYPWYIKVINHWIWCVNFVKKKFVYSPNLIQEIDDFEFINLPNFVKEDNQKTEISDEESNQDTQTQVMNIQQKIIEQLLYKAKPQKYPYSKIKRIKDTSIFNDILKLLLSIFVVLSGTYLYFIITKKSWPSIDIFVQLKTLDKFLLVILIIILFFFLVYFFRRVKALLTKSTISSKSKIGPFEISTKSEDLKGYSPFNVFSEELLYYFRKNKIKIVIFEDIDRFEDLTIFQELRELNVNINKRQPKIVFIYSLQDKIFNLTVKEGKANSADIENNDNVRLRAKFFDYVIPVFPVTNIYNSKDKIEEVINTYKGEQNSKFSNKKIFLMIHS